MKKCYYLLLFILFYSCELEQKATCIEGEYVNSNPNTIIHGFAFDGTLAIIDGPVGDSYYHCDNNKVYLDIAQSGVFSLRIIDKETLIGESWLIEGERFIKK